MAMISAISNTSKKIFNTASYASGLINSLRRKTFTAMGIARGVSHDEVRRDLVGATKEKDEVRMVLQSEAQKQIKATEGRGALILDFTVAIKRHAKKIESVVRQYAGSAGFKTAKGISLGMIAWTNLKELTLPIDLITWTKGDRPKNKILIELAISLAQRLDVSTLLADSFFATRHLFACLVQTSLFAVLRFKSNISVFVEGVGKFQLREHPAFKFSRNQRCIVREVMWHGFSLRVIAIKIFNTKSGWHVIFLVTNAPFEKACEFADLYKGRWKIEPVFRDFKQIRGLQDCQARSIKMQEAHFFACAYAFSMENINKASDATKSRPRKPFVPMFCKYRQIKKSRTRSIRCSAAVA
jgi:hypothetical protein